MKIMSYNIRGLGVRLKKCLIGSGGEGENSNGMLTRD